MRLRFTGETVRTVDAAPAKIDRSAFLYMAGGGENFAQCKTCALRNEDGECTIMGITVPDAASCGLYVPGQPCDCPAEALVDPKEAGYVKAEVRCENCVAAESTEQGGGNLRCGLYTKLNQLWPEKFALDDSVTGEACCNGWMPK